MGPGEDIYQALYDVQRKCSELNRKIDSIIRLMEMLTVYMQFMNSQGSEAFDAGFDGAFSNPQHERSDRMEQNDFQKMMSAAQNADHPMTDEEFNRLFDTLKQGKNPEEIARMEQMVQMIRGFMSK